MKIGFVFLVSLIIVTGVILFSCTKEKVVNNTPCTSCQKVTEAKDYFAFKVGSWWVYEEETSLERDSMYVTSSSITSGYGFDTYMYSSYQDYYYHFYPNYSAGSQNCSQTEPVNSKCLFVHREKYKPGDYIGYSTVFFVNYKIGDFQYTSSDMTYCPDNKIVISNIYSNYNLAGFIFDKTIKIHESCSFIDGKQPTNQLYSRGVGLIRKEYIDSNKIWNLVNYHIEL